MSKHQPAVARAEFDPRHFGVSIHVRREGGNALLSFDELTVVAIDHDSHAQTEATPLRLEEEDARAIYEALADYFGGSGHDTRALRKDYDAERARVDRLIEYATTPPIIINGGEIQR